MQAGRFLSLVKNVTDLRPEELKEARELAGQFPYSQLLHLLIARGARDQKGSDEQSALHRAAVYATDRAVLKAVMTRRIQPRVETDFASPAESAPATPSNVPAEKPPQEVMVETKKAVKKEKPEPKVVGLVNTSSTGTLEGDALRDDLKIELNRLHQLMSEFDATYEQLRRGETPSIKSQKKASPKSEAPKANPPSADPGEQPLIEEIKGSKRKPKMVTPKVAEQGEIIDQFIKVAPTLPRTKPTEPTTDLSEESVHYGDNIVSETLVEILLKQGKKAKAIEMLKKLIWKFPQKKAYFAAQIEALKS